MTLSIMVSGRIFSYSLIFILSIKCYDGRFSQEHSANDDYDPDVLRNISELITSKGYPVEEYNVVTKDGYILGVQRIPRGRASSFADKDPGPAVLLHHGLFSSGVQYVLNFPDQSLGFILADAGYDVWITNVRGTQYSKTHQTLTPKSREYWEFSFDQMALLDLTAVIDHILNATGQEKLFYVGHSMGTTAIFALLSDKPEYNDKVRAVVAMAPAVLMSHTRDKARIFTHFLNQSEFILELLGHGELLPNDYFQQLLRVVLCETEIRACYSWAKALTGMSVKQLNLTRVPVYLGSGIDGSSVHTFIHYGQLILSKKFQKFDFGAKENLIKYNQLTPPEYKVGRITTPVALMWGLNDEVADPVDVALLAQQLKNLVLNYMVPYPEWGHDDFALGLDAKTLVYPEVLKLFQKYLPL